jgi:uncharacterized protein YndB with AHSA1/START domain
METERTVDLPAEPDEVWEALTDDEALEAWFGDEDELAARRAARVDHSDPGRSLTWTWQPGGEDGDESTVSITLIPMPDGGTRLTVIESSPAVVSARLLDLELYALCRSTIRV